MKFNLLLGALALLFSGCASRNTGLYFAPPNNKPFDLRVSGMTKGYAGQTYVFEMSALDLDGDNLQFRIVIDEKMIGYSVPTPPGSEFQLKQSFAPGKHTIKIKAFDPLKTDSDEKIHVIEIFEASKIK